MKNNYLAKIEGHGKLDIDLKRGQVKLIINEGERLFEALVLGQKYSQVPFIVSRICGICPTAHNIASILALEKAMGLEVNQKVTDLRKIMLLAQMIQSHLLHLFFFTLPDYVRLDSGFDIAKKYPSEFSLVLRTKKTCDSILEIIGGRSVHPISTCVGGFRQKIKKEDLNKIITLINEIIDETENFVKFFDKLKYPSFFRETEYLSLSSEKEYPLLSDMAVSSFDTSFLTKNYKKEIKEQIKPYSSAKFGIRKRKDPRHALRGEKGFMVGALARVSLSQDKLNPMAFNLCQKLGVHFPTFNSYQNNFAQSIEVLHALEGIRKIADKLMSKDLEQLYTKPKIKAGSGVGAVEAPRGTLYHYYKVDKSGKITDCDIITPTVQNLTNLEEDAKKILKKGYQYESVLIKEVEMMIRAYDPCITCSVH